MQVFIFNPDLCTNFNNLEYLKHKTMLKLQLSRNNAEYSYLKKTK